MKKLKIFNTGPSSLINFSLVPRMFQGFGMQIDAKEWLAFKELEAPYHRKLEELTRRYRAELKQYQIKKYEQRRKNKTRARPNSEA
jgi:hypothetical protein